MSVYTLTKSGWFSLLVAALLTFGTGDLTLYGANSAPQLQNIGNRRVEPGKQISFQISASDADGNTLTYGVGTPPGGSFHVSPTGSDTNPGTRDQPFRTLERAKAAVRQKKAEGLPSGGLTVWIHGGIHERSERLLLEAADSGLSAEQPIRWRGFSGSAARISGGKVIPASQFALVTSASPVWNRMDASAKGQVRQIDLKPILGITAASTQAPVPHAPVRIPGLSQTASLMVSRSTRRRKLSGSGAIARPKLPNFFRYSSSCASSYPAAR